MYSIIRRLLFLFDAETIHVFSLKMLSFAHSAGLLRLFLKKRIEAPVSVMGIKFPNAVGLAAGLDDSSEDHQKRRGFGFCISHWMKLSNGIHLASGGK